MAQQVKIEKKCSKHDEEITFYCLSHKTGFCPTCLEFDEHRGCNYVGTKKCAKLIDDYYDKQNKELEQKMGVIAEYESKLKTMREKMGEDSKNSAEFYAQIQQAFQGEIARYRDQFRGAFERIDKDASDMQGTIAKVKEELQAATAQVSKEKTEVEGWKKGKDLESLVTRYDQLQNDHAPAGPEIAVLGDPVQRLLEPNQEYEKMRLPKTVFKKIESTLKAVHGEGIEDRSFQSETPFVYSMSPFESEILFYDIKTRAGHRLHMRDSQGKPYVAPYNFATVELHSRVFITGGTVSLQSPLNSFVEFSRLSNTVRTLPPMGVARAEHAMAGHASSLYVAGGRSQDGELKSAEKFVVSGNCQKGVWVSLRDMNAARRLLALCAFAAGPNWTLYAFGGMREGKPENSIERVSLANEGECWELIPMAGGDFVLPYSLGLVQINDGILMLGGSASEKVRSKDAILFQPAGRKFARVAGMLREEQFGGRHPVLAGGCVYAMGCFDIHAYNVEKQEWRAIAAADWLVY